MSCNLDLDFTVEDIDIELDSVQQITNADHNQLYNRGLSDQHPMEAITGLSGALNGLQSGIDDNATDIDGINAEIMEINAELDGTIKGESISNTEINDIFRMAVGN